jgi:tetratricopeptide (TPR) repeat protein
MVALFLAYLAFVARIPLPGFRGHQAFDPLAPRPHEVERLIVAKEYAAALPLALELRRSFPNEPQLMYWTAVIQQGLNDWSAEAEAWEEYVRASATPEEACPALPEAYSHLGAGSQALTAYERCSQFNPSDPDRLIDLANAYERSERVSEAIALYRQAAALDPFNPVLTSRFSTPSEGTR